MSAYLSSLKRVIINGQSVVQRPSYRQGGPCQNPNQLQGLTPFLMLNILIITQIRKMATVGFTISKTRDELAFLFTFFDRNVGSPSCVINEQSNDCSTKIDSKNLVTSNTMGVSSPIRPGSWLGCWQGGPHHTCMKGAAPYYNVINHIYKILSLFNHPSPLIRNPQFNGNHFFLWNLIQKSIPFESVFKNQSHSNLWHWEGVG